MEKKEKRLSYFTRLKKKRELKQNQLEKVLAEEDQSNPDLTGSIKCEPAPIAQLQEKSLDGEEPRSLSANSADYCKSNGQAKKEKRKPPGTIEYIVDPKDTVNSIALKFNITPTNLMQLNRLFSRSVIPGQKLFVPDMGQSGTSSQVSSDSVNKAASEKGLQDEKLRSRNRELSPPSEDESPVKFLKMSCKYFTDGMGVVGGVMIVTPNNIMFDPNKSDPLVIEHGCEEYGLICPMEEVLSVALYDDLSHMKLKDALPSDIPQDLCPLYRPGEWVELPSEQDLNPFSRYEALSHPSRPVMLDDMETAISDDAECHLADKSPSDEGFTELELLQNDSGTENGSTETSHSRPETVKTTCLSLERALLQGLGESEEVRMNMQKCTGKITEEIKLCNANKEEEEEDEGLNHSTDVEPVLGGDENGSLHVGVGLMVVDELKDGEGSKKPEAITNDAFQVEAATAIDQNAIPDSGSIPGNSGKSSGPSHEEDMETTERPNFSDQLFKKESDEQTNEAEMKSWLLKRMQGPIEDILLCTEEKSKKPPMFLCFKVRKPMRKSFATGRTSSPTHSFVGNGRQPEYWFAVPQERVDHIYSFFIQWSPDAYGKDAQDHGFVVVEKDELNMIDNFFSDPVPRNWEIITMNEAKRRQSCCSFEDEEPLDMMSFLMDPSTLLEDTHIEKLAARLPARVQGYPWRLAYSTVVHGTSLKTLYRNLGELECPVLMVIKDMDNQVFGVFSTHPFRVSEHYYGTGETFLYTFCPEIKVFRWTGENSYFVKGNLDSLQIGGGGGHFGLWLDADLYHGTTSKCSTFNNQPLSSQQDFTVQNLEVWAFD